MESYQDVWHRKMLGQAEVFPPSYLYDNPIMICGHKRFFDVLHPLSKNAPNRHRIQCGHAKIIS